MLCATTRGWAVNATQRRFATKPAQLQIQQLVRASNQRQSGSQAVSLTQLRPKRVANHKLIPL